MAEPGAIVERLAKTIDADAWSGRDAPGTVWLVRRRDYARNRARAVLSAVADEIDAIPEQVLQFWDRPGGPPGNGYRPTTPKDVAAMLRAELQSKEPT